MTYLPIEPRSLKIMRPVIFANSDFSVWLGMVTNYLPFMVFTTWYLHDGKVKAALTVGRSDDLDHGRRLGSWC